MMTLKGFVKERMFDRIMQNIKPKIIIHSMTGTNQIVFGIVHWNAPEFLLLNIRQIQKFHPESKIYVFDNASSIENLQAITSYLMQVQNVTLFSNRKDYSQTWASHIIGLQFILNYAAKEKDENIVFLDQDCILTEPIDDLVTKLNVDTWLIGARDYVVKQHDYGPLKKGLFRQWHEAVHGSFMIMNPKSIRCVFGEKAFLNTHTFEAYHGISEKTKGHILFLETEMHNEIPMLTRYYLGNKTYAWHSWFSSRAYGMKNGETLNMLPVSWIKETLDEAKQFLEQQSHVTST